MVYQVQQTRNTNMSPTSEAYIFGSRDSLNHALQELVDHALPVAEVAALHEVSRLAVPSASGRGQLKWTEASD